MSTHRVLPVFALFSALIASGQHIAVSRTPEGGFADIVEKTLPTAVRVVVISGLPEHRRTEGSGVIVAENGYLLTNEHVVEGAAKITVQLNDEREMAACVIAGDVPTDIALLKINASQLKPITFGDSGRVRIGDYALAVGNPFGVGIAVSLGIVSSKGEGDYIQTDAAMNPGNSGGPLLNIRGELIGINTAIVSSSGGSSGVGLSLPSNTVRFVMNELMTKGRVDHGYLGVGLQQMTESLQEALGVRRGGAVISDVAPGSPAARAGLQKGDVVVALNGRVLRDLRRLQLYSALVKPNTGLELIIARQDTEMIVPVTLTERPQSLPMPEQEVIAGVTIADTITTATGPVVTAVDPRCASADAGLRAGDVIIAADRKPISGMADLRGQFANRTSKPVLLEVSRGGSTYFIALPRP